MPAPGLFARRRPFPGGYPVRRVARYALGGSSVAVMAEALQYRDFLRHQADEWRAYRAAIGKTDTIPTAPRR